jgi:hypothetical protein
MHLYPLFYLFLVKKIVKEKSWLKDLVKKAIKDQRAIFNLTLSAKPHGI